VGGEGTRLRPITSRLPKPVAPLVTRPFIGFILEDLAHHGVGSVVFSAGFLSGAVREAVGDGSAYGLRASYVVEDAPLGTAGAIKNAEAELGDGRLLAFNGDVLTDVDLTALVDFHVAKGGAATILLHRVDDARRYGLVRLGDDEHVREFLEKPGAEHEGPGLINAGVYVLEREVLDMIPAGQNFSIERGVFPKLAAAGRLFGYESDAYWRDIGTPESYLEAHFDLLEGSVSSTLREQLGAAYVYVAPSATVDPGARVVPPAYVAGGATLAPGCRVGPLAVLGENVSVGTGASVTESVLQDDVIIGADAVIEHSVLVKGSSVGSGSHLRNAILGADCRVGADNVVANGCCLYPDTMLADGSMKFRDIDTEGR
jgi:mannose-1-phosphate guanylyltransferase